MPSHNKTYTEYIKKFYDTLAPIIDNWREKNRYYHEQITQFYLQNIPQKSSVLEIGCATGTLLAALKPKKGVGLDISQVMITQAMRKHPHLNFQEADAHNFTRRESFDAVVLCDLIGSLHDVQKALQAIQKVSSDNTRIIITQFNFLWEPLLTLAEKLRLKAPSPPQNWLSSQDVNNLLQLAQFEVIKNGTFLLIPFFIPFLSNFCNRYVARLPLIKHLCCMQYFVARVSPQKRQIHDYSVSVIVPARNEAGTIEELIVRTPRLGKSTEIIFVEGGSGDTTKEAIKQAIKKYKKTHRLSLIEQGRGRGKADAVRRGFAKAKGDILMILDADLSVAPEELLKFYDALQLRRGEFVMGSRLVYPLEDQAMRFLNILGNKFFSLAFSWLLDQPIKDTLCGTKVLYRQDYEGIVKNRSYFGDFDPFGDFDLIFGANKLNLKILEIPIRYYARRYGQTNISRFRHGWLLLRMTLFAARKIKFT